MKFHYRCHLRACGDQKIWKSKIFAGVFLSFTFSFTKIYQKWLQNSRFLPFLDKKDWKSEKFHKKPKICIVFVVFLLYFKIFNFKLFGHFWLIFRSQFSFFAILGVKKSKSEKFYEIWLLVFRQTVFLHFVKFFRFWIFDPQNGKKRKLALEN